MPESLKTKRIAILVTDGFEQVELIEPRRSLERAGGETHIVSPSRDNVRGWHYKKWGKQFIVDRPLEDVNPQDYDALLLPGGVMNPDKLRLIPAAIGFVKEFVHAVKPIAAICHAPWILINASGVDGKNITSWGSVKIDLINAGAKWVDEEVVRDGQLVTSRKPDDIPAFNKAMIALFSESRGRAKETVGVR